ncbi:MAG: SDR family oxidoreductase [Cyclobacteriaceae bacterium]
MPHAIITGASKGLGNSFAHQLAERGYDLLLIARSEKILVEEATLLSNQFAVNVSVLALDLRQENSVSIIGDWCEKNQFNPSVLINNAGYTCWGWFDTLSLPDHQHMMQVNVGTVINLTHRLLPLLRKHEHAYILNVASTAAFQAVPTMIVYAASKAFIRSFSRGLRYELRNTSVSVTCLSPGPVATNFIQQGGMEAMQETAKKYEMAAGDVVRAGLKAMFNRKAECIPGFLNYLTVKLSFILPDALLEKIAGNLYQSKLK